MPQFTSLKSRVIALPQADVDTDQIIPARFLKVTDKLGLGALAFHDWRYHEDGSPRPDFPLNLAENRGAQILLAGDNFGCGSSREHAPWALVGFGLRAVISTSFADIFQGNALKNGLLPVVVDAATHRALLEERAKDATIELAIDLATQTVSLPWGGSVSFAVDAFSKRCLLDGVDELGYLLGHEAAIARFEAERPT
jgi:3-isopropylmalate/(R)-2-methylmalate dehydratase small subunit